MQRPFPISRSQQQLPSSETRRVYEGELQPQRARLSSPPATAQSPWLPPGPPRRPPAASGRRARAAPSRAGSAPQRCPPLTAPQPCPHLAAPHPAGPRSRQPRRPVRLPAARSPSALPSPCSPSAQPWSHRSLTVPRLRGQRGRGRHRRERRVSGTRGERAPPVKDGRGISVAIIGPQIFVPSSGPASGPWCPRLNSVLITCPPEEVPAPSGCCPTRWAAPTSSARQAARPPPLPVPSGRDGRAPPPPLSAGAGLLPPGLGGVPCPFPAVAPAGQLPGPSRPSLPAAGQRAQGVVPVEQHRDPALPARPRSRAGGRGGGGAGTISTLLPLVPELGLCEEHLTLVRPGGAADRTSSLSRGLQPRYCAMLVCLLRCTRLLSPQRERRDFGAGHAAVRALAADTPYPRVAAGGAGLVCTPQECRLAVPLQQPRRRPLDPSPSQQ